MLNITEEDDENHNNDYTPIEVPRARKEERPKMKEEVDIDLLIMNEKVQP